MFRSPGLASSCRTLGVVLVGFTSLTGFVSGGPAPAGASRAANCPWTVKSVREPTPEEASLEKALAYPPLDPDRTNVPGPNATRLTVRRGTDQHPTVYLEDATGGKANPLVRGWSYLPSWSPSGKLAACLLWKSDRRSDLAIVEVATEKILLIDSTLSASHYEWSPDSKSIAACGNDRRSRKAVVAWVDVDRGRSRRVDWTIADVDYEIDWSPDSQCLAFTRPTSVTKYGDLSGADLWIAGNLGRKKCCVLAMPDKLELHPRWFGPQAIRITSAPSKEEEGAPDREGAPVQNLVIELTSPEVAVGGGRGK